MLVTALIPCFLALAQETNKEPSTADQITALTTAYQEKVDAFYKEYRAAGTAEERTEISGRFPDAGEVLEPLMALVASDLRSEDAATAANWALRNVRTSPSEAVVSIVKAQAASEEFTDLALGCLYVQADEIAAVLEQVVAENPNTKARAAAAFARSNAMARKAMARNADPDESTNLKRRQFLDIAVEHGKEVMLGSRSISERAASTIFEMENLQVGMAAPDIKGEDLDGVEFALSEYRGKVVVIDFWGDW